MFCTNLCISINSGFMEIHPDTYDRSKSGWFHETTFTDWFFTLMLLKLQKQDGKRVFSSKNLSSHLSWAFNDVVQNIILLLYVFSPMLLILFIPMCCLVQVFEKNMEKGAKGVEKITKMSVT